MHVVRQDPRMVRSDPDCILGHSAGALPRMWQLDLDTVSVSGSCDGNTVRGIRVVCCWALANNMDSAVEGTSVSRTLLSVVAMPSRIWTTRRRNCATRCRPTRRAATRYSLRRWPMPSSSWLGIPATWRFALVGLILLATVPGVSSGQHPFVAPRPTIVACGTLSAGSCRLKTEPPCTGRRSARVNREGRPDQYDR